MFFERTEFSNEMMNLTSVAGFKMSNSRTCPDFVHMVGIYSVEALGFIVCFCADRIFQ